MTKRTVGLAIVAVAFAFCAVLQASDRIGVYAVVEKVTLEPSDTAP